MKMNEKDIFSMTTWRAEEILSGSLHPDEQPALRVNLSQGCLVRVEQLLQQTKFSSHYSEYSTMKGPRRE